MRRFGPALPALALACLLTVPAVARGAVTPLPASDYGVHAACSLAAPGRAGCLALELVPLSEEARRRARPLAMQRAHPLAGSAPHEGAFGLRPQDLHSAYSLPTSAPSSQTIALVDAYNDPTAEADLKAYDEEFGLPLCTSANGCFKQVNERGEAGNLPFPKTTAELESFRKGTASQREEAAEATGWGLEIALDVEAAQAMCQSCKIALVEAAGPYNSNLATAEGSAVTLGAREISNSWGGAESGAATRESPFNHRGVVITAAAGDNGYLDWGGTQPGYAEFPASSPHVVAVGGTRLSVGTEGEWAGESVWNGNGAGGGGCSIEFAAQAWQQSVADWSGVGCASKRSVADVAAVADPYTGFAVHATSRECESATPYTHWCTVGGTSLSSPLVAAVFALAGGAEGVPYPAATLYANAASSPGSLHDITEGSNGECTAPYTSEGLSGCTPAEEAQSCTGLLRCLAGTGYDGPTGLGTPDGLAAFKHTGAPAHETLEEGTGGQGSGGGSSSGAAQGAASPPAGASGSSTSAPPPPPPAPSGPAAPAPLRLSALRLTARAAAAVRHRRPRIRQLAFSFTSSRAARVRATLYRRVRVHGRLVWARVAPASAIAAGPGRHSAHLAGRRALAAGSYRLTLSAGAASVSVAFAVR